MRSRAVRKVAARSILCLACAVAGACDWPWRHDMADQPSPATRQGPRSPAPGATPLGELGPIGPGGERALNPLPRSEAAKADGQALYAIYCVACHGPNGSGAAASVAKYFPRIGDLASADVQRHDDGWLYRTITTGTSTMPAYGHELDSSERWKIVQFVRTLAH